MTPSIQLARSPRVDYLLRIGDTCLILSHRLSEWCGHAPALEEDIAMTNIALDLVGQARALLTHAGQLEDQGHDEDQLAFLRDERDYLNPTLVELPHGDFADTVVRNAMVTTFLKLLWERLATSTDTELAGIAEKALKEARYHQSHSFDWVVRLGDGTDESNRRSRAALDNLWRFMPEWFEDDAVDRAVAAEGFGPAWSELEAAWRAEMAPLLAEATLTEPAALSFRSTGRRGVHSEHMGFLLATMQSLPRAFPGAVW